eukprot:GHRR01011387.1.p1 GENE.GHRR01011387.1~~GHRR01011387.1.p1  ORF type:complete len:497 (+),score=185.06 GHRR01011387.1:77-1567(+)
MRLRDGKTITPEVQALELRRTRRRSTRSASASQQGTPTVATYLPDTKRARQPVIEAVAEPDEKIVAQIIGEEDVKNPEPEGLQDAACTVLPADSVPSPGPTSTSKVCVEEQPAAVPASPPVARVLKQQEGNCNTQLWVSLVLAALLLAVAAAATQTQHGHATWKLLRGSLGDTSTHIKQLRLQDTLQQQLTAWQVSAGIETSAIAHSMAAAAQHIQLGLLQAHAKLSALMLHRDWSVGHDQSAWAPEVLASVLPSGQQWQDLAADMSEKLRLPPLQRNHKGIGIILACESGQDCTQTVAALAALPPQGDVCTLLVNSTDIAGEPSQAAAALQAQLAPFLLRCPTGLVVLLQAERLPVAAMSAVQNALSELGGFQHGGRVDSTQAAYVLLLQLPAQDVAAAAAAQDTASASDMIKGAFFNIKQQQLQEQQQQQQEQLAGTWAAVSRSLKAFHRRIDFAAPIKLGAAATEALKSMQQAAASEGAQAHAVATESYLNTY